MPIERMAPIQRPEVPLLAPLKPWLGDPERFTLADLAVIGHARMGSETWRVSQLSLLAHRIPKRPPK
jgi:hypothetical protein